MFNISEVQETARDWNAYTLHIWPDLRRPKSPFDNQTRLLAVCFNLATGRMAFIGAVRQFPGRSVTLRERCRIVCSSERQDHIDHICAQLGITDVPRAAPEC